MRRKSTDPAPVPSAASGDALCDELAQLGLPRGDARALAARLRGLARDLSAREYRALLDGIALGRSTSGGAAGRTPELARILEDFASELKKLDEGLRVLTAFLSRIRDHTSDDVPKTLH